jgi:class 3 adenylate cyclase
MARQLQTFLFADISGYSRLAEVGGDEVAAELALRFADEVSGLAAEHGAEVVKQIGDAVMLRGEAAAEVVTLGLRLNSDLSGLPPIHAGVHTGFAIRRGGDWWGTTVNVAARVAAAAEGGQLLVTEATRAAGAALAPARLEGLGMLRLKNISSPVRVYSAVGRPVRLAATNGRLRRAGAQRASQLSLFDREWRPAEALALVAGA